MTIKEKREKRELKMRQDIMTAAIKIINDQGYDKLSLRKIAKEIGYSAPHIYNYYSDKADIIHNIVRNLYSRVIYETVHKVEENHGESFEFQFYFMIKTFVRAAVREPESIKAVLRSGFNLFYDDTSALLQGITELQRFLGYGERNEVFKHCGEEVPQLLIVSMLGLVSHIVHSDITDEAARSQLIDDYSNLLFTGIKLRSE